MAERFRSPYEGYDVLDKTDTPSWNDITRRVVARRLREVPPRRFFGEAEWALLEAVCARILPQPERAEPVPIAPWVDDRLFRGKGNGYRYAGMPPDREAWPAGLRALDGESRLRHGKPFTELAETVQDDLLRAVQRGEVSPDVWERLSPVRFFDQLLRQVLAVYYAHPAAWSEIGFGGPASPRGYVRLGRDEADPWEARKAEPEDG